MQDDFDESLVKELQVLLGKDGVLFGESAQQTYGVSTIGVSRTIDLALKPKNKEEVVSIVRFAADHRLHLYPISTGNNWGYGSAMPASQNTIVLDLSGMNKIIEFDQHLGLITVEPGVTHTQLKNFLADRGSQYTIPATGGGGGCSIIGNVLERGYGASSPIDRFASIQSLEVVLADGTLYRSAFAEYGYAHFKWGIGPYIDGLFGQSNLGIVVGAVISLARTPERVEVSAFSLKKGGSLSEFVDIVRVLSAELGENLVSVRMQNTPRLATRVAAYPKQLVIDGLIPDHFFEEFARQYSLHEWFVIIAVQGNHYTIGGVKRTIKRRVRGFSSWPIFFFDSGSFHVIQTFFSSIPFLTRYTNLVHVVRSHLYGAQGIAAEDRPGRLPYWKLLGEMNSDQYREFMSRTTLDPDDEKRCGLIFYSGVIPMKGAVVEEAIAQAESICKEYKILPLLSISVFTERSLYFSLPLLFDRQNEEEKNRAYKCYEALHDAGGKHGFPLYRAGIHAMDMVVDMDHPFWQTAEKIKKALDPDNIMSPGRYSKYKRSDEE